MAFNILIVDDESSNLHVMRSILQSDYSLTFAKCGAKAIALAMEQCPDLILLDVMLPDMDGYQICRDLKTSQRTASIPVVFVSALDEQQNQIEGMKSGGDDFIIKPVDPNVLRQKVAKILEDDRLQVYQQNTAALVYALTLSTEKVCLERVHAHLRVAKLACWLGVKYGLSENVAEDLSLAVPLCDWAKGRDGTHALIDVKHTLPHIFSSMNSGFCSVLVTLLRHEGARWDGVGEVNLRQTQIPDVVRVFTAARHIDTLMFQNEGDIPIRCAMMLDQLARLAGSEIDPQFLYLLTEYQAEFCVEYQNWFIDPSSPLHQTTVSS